MIDLAIRLGASAALVVILNWGYHAVRNVAHMQATGPLGRRHARYARLLPLHYVGGALSLAVIAGIWL